MKIIHKQVTCEKTSNLKKYLHTVALSSGKTNQRIDVVTVPNGVVSMPNDVVTMPIDVVTMPNGVVSMPNDVVTMPYRQTDF